MGDLTTLLERGWNGLTGAVGVVRPRTAAALFRKADRYRNEGRYDEAARLVSQGLDLAPESSVGHLLSAYLYAAARDMDRAKAEFARVLALDPYHPRALLGLARIDIEEQDLDSAKELLDRAVEFYTGFPEARALREMVLSWGTQPVTEPAAASTMTHDDLDLTSAARDLVLTQADGALVFARVEEERARLVSQHLTQLTRMAAALLSRAGLGALRRGAVDTESEMTFLLERRRGEAHGDDGRPRRGRRRTRPERAPVDQARREGLIMSEPTSYAERVAPPHDVAVTAAATPARPSRARLFKEILAGLSTTSGIRGGLLVTPDGLVITSDLPPRSQVEALAALGATLGRELELGAGRLGRQAFRTAFFSGEHGTLFVGSSQIGFLVLIGDRTADIASVRVALARALDHLHQ